eukprot:jgi/Tetstr1/453432/TSEL_040414.t1
MIAVSAIRTALSAGGSASRPEKRTAPPCPLGPPVAVRRGCGIASVCQRSVCQRASLQDGATVAAAEAAKYVPSPMDYSTLVPQLVAMGFLALCVAYFQVVLAPTAQVKFNMADKEKREYVKGVLKDDDSSPLQRALYRLWLKPLARPRGDQTQGEGQAGPAPRGSSAPHASRLNGLALDYSGADRQADRLRAGAPGTPPTASEQIAQLQVEVEDAAHLMGRCSLASHYHLGGPSAAGCYAQPAGAVLELAGAESDDELEMPAAPELGEEAAAGQPAQSDGAGPLSFR